MATATRPDLDLDALLAPLARSRSAVVRVADLPAIWGMDPDDATDLAADLECEGWIQSWECIDEHVVILSSRAAERLGIELEPADASDVTSCRWVPIGASRPPPRPRRKSEREVLESELWKPGDGFGLDSLPDPRTVRPPPRPRGGILRPWLLIGLRPPWSGPKAAEGPCKGCGGLDMAEGSVCLLCLRSAWDAQLVSIRPLPKDKPPPERKAPKRKAECGGLAGGMGERADPKGDFGAMLKRAGRAKAKKKPRRATVR